MENPGRYLAHIQCSNGKKGRNKKTLIALSSVVLSPPFPSPLTNVLGYSRHGIVENILWDRVDGTSWHCQKMAADLVFLASAQIRHRVQLSRRNFGLKKFYFMLLWEFYLGMSWEDAWRFYCCSEYGMLPTSV